MVSWWPSHPTIFVYGPVQIQNKVRRTFLMRFPSLASEQMMDAVNSCKTTPWKAPQLRLQISGAGCHPLLTPPSSFSPQDTSCTRTSSSSRDGNRSWAAEAQPGDLCLVA